MMKLGTETASVVNHLQARMVKGEPRPEVGMGVTLLLWSDRHPGTITKVEEIGGSRVTLYIVWVTKDDYKVTKGSMHDGSAEYEFTACPDGVASMFRKNKKTGFWESVRRNPDTNKLNKTNGPGLRIGAREKHYDPSF